MQKEMIFSSLLEAVPLPGLLITGENRILCANSAALLLFGNNVVGLAYISVLRHPAVLKAIEVTLGGQAEAKTRYIAALGDQDVTYDMTCRRVKIAKKNLILVCFRDVTDVEQATQMRRDFVANVSHELRTPLTALSGFIETLQGPAREDAAARKRFLDIMAKEAARMNRLVDDLLSLSRVESDERMRPIEQVELNGLLQSCIITMAASAKSEKVDMTLLGDESSEYFIQGDEDQLRQVFNNLLENAIKYGGANGRITVGIELVDHDATLRGPAICLCVCDTGPGIDPLHIPRLTERFYRVDSHRSRAVGGTGLGLAIVKHIVNRHRGRLAIASTPCEGTAFSVLLPALSSA